GSNLGVVDQAFAEQEVLSVASRDAGPGRGAAGLEFAIHAVGDDRIINARRPGSLLTEHCSLTVSYQDGRAAALKPAAPQLGASTLGASFTRGCAALNRVEQQFLVWP